jgi:hypothetical protein
MFELESQIRTWKRHIQAAGSIGYSDSIDELSEQGVSEDEAFLLAVRRLGDTAVIHEEFAKLTTEDLWRSLFVPADSPLTARRSRIELLSS